MATGSSFLAWRVPWTEESGGLQSTKLQRVGYEIRNPSSAINAKKYMKTIEWESLEILSRKLEKSREHYMQRCDQYKEIEENNRMGKTRDFFKKIRDTKGRSHAKMGTIKDRNSMDLIEAEDIQKRWQEYTEELYKKRSSRPR